MVPVGSSVMLELVLAVHSYHVIAYPEVYWENETVYVIIIDTVKNLCRLWHFLHFNTAALSLSLSLSNSLSLSLFLSDKTYFIFY